MEYKKRITTARLTGIWYLLLAISGVLGFLIFHPQIFVSNDPQKTLTNLTELKSTSRIRLLLEVVIIASQALAAVWFYKLFREIKSWAAFAIGSWGLMNSAAIMVSAISMGAAINIADFATPSFQEKVVFIQLLSNIISHAWIIGGLFFGLWLIPMGYVVAVSKCMPIWLGRILMIGGIGYILSTFFNCLGFSHALMDILTIPATIGEFWMIGYLLIYEIRPLNNIDQR
ncbi:DUF4386 domain-containing protein [Flavobacterium limi]|uniref:DUF4386 domain-containing protein n=1 Tax=Flavobacterium limi TaxID=2045105 RepID=A0ABQ1TYU3_9FLAO|nr:DUF4386 domain-containing protein [Flavobacterium limi]GGF04451.1 hypothetical protein GCM10011518_12100 [Flavobacterium limi]